MNSIPADLILEISSRLPAKSIARFYSVSKLWASVLHRPYFTELFLTKSSARPRLLLAIETGCKWHFFSLLQPCEKSPSLVVAADFHTKFPGDNLWVWHNTQREFACSYASGLIYFSGMWSLEKSKDTVPVIYNPNTGKYVTLPILPRYRQSYSFLGFDPVDKEYKVLFMASRYCSEGDDHRILTLGTEKIRWKKIGCSLTHEPLSEGICINGVLYYLAKANSETSYEIVSFDVKSEEFTFIRFIASDDISTARLINYKGKLGVINWKYIYTNGTIRLRMLILEDVGKPKWSKHTYTLQDNKLYDLRFEIYVVGVTAMTGEIVLSMTGYRPLYLFFYSPEKNTLKSVEIQGLGPLGAKSATHLFWYGRVFTFIDHVEDLNVNDAKAFKSSIYAPYVKDKRSLEKEQDTTKR